MADKYMKGTGTFAGEKGPKPKKGEIIRTRSDISRAETHFLGITLRRTASRDPRTFYSLVGYEVIPFSWIEEAWQGRAAAAGPSVSMSPKAVLERDKIERKRDGTLGSALVISCELPPGSNQSPREALQSLNITIMHPLGLFKVHRDTLSRLCHQPPVPASYFEQCLINSLKGGAYAMSVSMDTLDAGIAAEKDDEWGKKPFSRVSASSPFTPGYGMRPILCTLLPIITLCTWQKIERKDKSVAVAN
ncbi:hypothetical protein HWV62_22949 [Athelia sp. TMB]|nr:hypothetical protein HWV62_22949 [Athelia sp. TMB]